MSCSLNSKGNWWVAPLSLMLTLYFPPLVPQNKKIGAENYNPGAEKNIAMSHDMDTPGGVDAPSSSAIAVVIDGSDRRRAIQGILADKSLTDLERRLRVQRLMDGSSSTINNDNKDNNVIFIKK